MEKLCPGLLYMFLSCGLLRGTNVGTKEECSISSILLIGEELINDRIVNLTTTMKGKHAKKMKQRSR
jgi:hypothetical protein